MESPGLMVRQRLEFRYDAGGRRIAKKVLHAEGNGNFVLKSSQVFLYDGWNMIGELQLKESGTGLQPVILRTYEWGPDVSGSFTGAGGVGGLILIRQTLQPSILRNITSKDEPQTAFAPCYDGNGNVTELCALSTSTVAARYEYSAFGETITTDGSAIADSNPFRFSTKYEDRETGFYYYGYRYYAPETGRWLSRDPIGERGGINLYGVCENNALDRIDRLGLETKTGSTEHGTISIEYSLDSNSLKTAVTFTPNRKCCENILFIQTQTRSPNAGALGEAYDFALEGRRTGTGWSVDRLSQRPSPYYGIGRDGKPEPWSSSNPKEGYRTEIGNGANGTPAKMRDKPDLRPGTKSLNFETCAQCTKGNQIGVNYGCVTWGITDGILAEPEITNKPSPEFKDAVDAWNKQANDPNPPLQQPAPTQR